MLGLGLSLAIPSKGCGGQPHSVSRPELDIYIENDGTKSHEIIAK